MYYYYDINNRDELMSLLKKRHKAIQTVVEDKELSLKKYIEYASAKMDKNQIESIERKKESLGVFREHLHLINYDLQRIEKGDHDFDYYVGNCEIAELISFFDNIVLTKSHLKNRTIKHEVV